MSHFFALHLTVFMFPTVDGRLTVLMFLNVNMLKICFTFLTEFPLQLTDLF